MSTYSTRPAFGGLIYFGVTMVITGYFIFAAMQGDFGLFRRAEIVQERALLERQLHMLRTEQARMENLTLRLSDEHLDLDLLDQQTRKVLGMVRGDEVVVE